MLLLLPGEELLEGHEEEVGLEGPLVHLVHQHVRGARERRVRLEAAEEDARRAEEEARVAARAVLAADGVAHRAAHLLAALRRDALRHADRADAPRLRADDAHGRALRRRVLEEELRDLRRLAAARLALYDARPRQLAATTTATTTAVAVKRL